MVIYLDNAATSWPKPPGVKEAMAECLDLYCANPGRGGHKMSVKASRILFETRVNLSKLFGIKNPNDVSFAANTTAALNQAIKGFVKRGDHVILTSVEHNSVRRPLEYLRRTADVQLTYVHADRQGRKRSVPTRGLSWSITVPIFSERCCRWPISGKYAAAKA